MRDHREEQPPSVDRRQALGLLGAGAAMLGASVYVSTATAAAGTRATPDFDDPATRLDAVVKLRGCLDPRAIWHWLIGRRYAVTSEGVLPLCSVYNCSIVRWQRTSRDRYDLPVLEYNFNTDFDTGEWRDELVMPVTGRRVKAPAPRGEIVRHAWQLTYRYEGTLADAGEFSEGALRRFGADARTSIDRRVHGPELLGDEVAFTQDWSLRIDSTTAGVPPVGIREVANFVGSMRDVADPAVRCAPSRTSYSIVYGFPEWTHLQHVPGHVLTSGVGGKALRSGELPAAIQRLLKLKHPEALGDIERLMPA